MLPELFDWPMAVDNWETHYGTVGFPLDRASAIDWQLPAV
jgi:hypothetical protein